MDFLRRNNNRRNNHRRSHHDKEEYNSQGGDDEGDDDDDDDAVIVYKEATTTNWAHSQISMASTRSKQRRQKQKQQQHDEEEEQQQQQQENDQKNQENNEQVSAIISRKRSGRRNRSCRPFHSREREQHLFNNDYEEPASVEEDDNRDNNSDDDDDNVDAFASLRPMMVQLSQEQKMGLSQQQQQQQEKSDDDDDDDDGQSEKTETIQHGEDNNHTEEVSLGRGSSRCIDSGGGGLYGLNLNIQSKVSKINTKKTPLPPSLEKENTNELRAVGQDSDRKSVPILNNNNNNRIRHNKSLLPVEIDGNDDRSTKKLRALSPVELNHVVCSPPDFDICDDSNDHDDDNDDDDNSTESIFPYRLRGSKDHDHNSLLSTTRNSTRPSMTNSMSMNQNKKRSSSDRSNNNIKEKRQRKQMALLRNNNSSDRTGRVDIDAACGSKRRDQRVDTNSSTTTTTTKRRLRQDTKVSSSATATATVTTTTTSTASRTHRIKRIDKSSRNQHCSSTTLTSEKKIKLQKPSRPKAPTDVENVKKSIVGVRPTHWSRNPREDQNKRMISKGKKSLHQLAKPSALAAATRTPFKLTKTIGKEKKKNAVSNIHSNNNAPSSKNEIDVTTTENNNTTRSPDGEMKISSFSFAPSFVPTKSIASVAASLIDDTVGDDSGDECRLVTSNRLVLTGTNTSNILSPPYAKRRRSNKTVTGEWGRRLIALRNSRANDSVRLQNQAFARRRMFDVNDPRKRAKTFTDVTIMGSYNGPWINRPEDMKITILGYVHRHIQKNNNSYTKGNNQLHDQCHHHHQQQLLQQEADNIFSQDYFAWFTFTLATARCINLERACKLRIYNAIILRCRMPTRLDLPPKSFGGSNSKNIIRCEKIVICTHLCERTDGTASSS